MGGRAFSARAASTVLLALEAIGSALMWAPLPLGWMWVGGRVYDATNSLAVDLAVVMLGFLLSVILVMRALTRIDTVWIALRRRAGYDQPQGALTRVVVVSATLGIVAFLLWYYLLERAFILPFMPSQ